MTRTVSKAIVVGDNVLTVPVEPAIQRIIEEWASDHIEDLHARLAEFGINAHSLTAPEYHRVVTEADLNG